MMRRVCCLALLCVLLSIRGSPAQVFGTGVMPVVEIGMQLYETVVIAFEAVAQTINQILDLTPVDDIIIAQGIGEDLGQLADIMAKASAVTVDVQQVQAQIEVLFDFHTAPDTPATLDARLLEMRQAVFEARTFALQATTLVKTVVRTIEHINGLVESIGGFVGNMQGNQTLVQTQVTVSKTLAVMEVQQAASQRADVLMQMERTLVVTSWNRIQCKAWSDWPGFQGCP